MILKSTKSLYPFLYSVQNRHRSWFVMGIMWLFLSWASCSSPEETSRSVSGIESVDLTIIRFENELCSVDITNDRALESLTRNYPIFTETFFNQVIFPKNTASIPLEDLVQNYCTSPAIEHLMDTVRILYPNLTELEATLGLGLGYLRHYFPELPTPRVFSYVSEFGIGVFTVDTHVLGIGLDFFLGNTYPYYDPAVFPIYMQATMTPEYISASSFKALAETIVAPITKANFLDYMIRNGKILYLISRLLPEEPMYRIHLYLPEQMEWVRQNEFNIWSYLLDQGLFYESDPRKFKKFIDPAPRTPGLPEIAPGRVANWIGYRIIESYMNQNPGVSMEALAANTDFQAIMDDSKYKPVRPKL